MSVVLTVGAVDPALRRALQSVVMQTYPAIEIVLVSRETSCEQGRQLAAVLGEIVAPKGGQRSSKLVHIPAEEREAALLATGIAQAGGRIIALARAGDWYSPERLARLVTAMVAGNSAIGFSAVRITDAQGADVSGREFVASRRCAGQWRIKDYPELGFAALAEDVLVADHNLVFERDLFDKLGGFRDFRLAATRDLLFRAMLVEQPVFVPDADYLEESLPGIPFERLATLREELALARACYFQRVQRLGCVNSRAPAPEAWPGIFEFWLQLCDLAGAWNDAQRVTPPAPVRAVAASALPAPQPVARAAFG